MFNPHLLVKFWARKEPEFIISDVKGAKIIADPFCGSGSTGFSAIFVGASALLSDINPVSVFIAYNILNDNILEDDTIRMMREVCHEIQNEVYTLNNSRVINFVVWKTIYKCPFCNKAINSKAKKVVSCRNCGASFPKKNIRINEKIVLLKFASGKGSRSKKLISDYLSLEESLEIKFWHPHGKFIYPGTEIEFRDGPHRHIEIKDLFTKRNLYAVSKLYSYIEKIWKKDRSQGDLLKLVFIASLANATKMMPHSKSSGPSWKVPRYWIPNLREERNFCKSFLRRLFILASFKERWSKVISDYQITVSYNGELSTSKKNFIHISKANALEVYKDLPKVDLVVLDPPHYDEINYFELTYLWQRWLEGSKGDERFRDYDYWKDEVCVNKKIGKDIEWYNSRLTKVVSSYSSRLSKNGKIILIMHNRNTYTLKRTIDRIKKVAGEHFTVDIEYRFPRISSSTQGLHRHRKYLCVLKIRRFN